MEFIVNMALYTHPPYGVPEVKLHSTNWGRLVCVCQRGGGGGGGAGEDGLGLGFALYHQL